MSYGFKQIKKKLNKNSYSNFGSVHNGLISTCDMFISDNRKIEQLSKEIPGQSVVEMEGAEIAQVALKKM